MRVRSGTMRITMMMMIRETRKKEKMIMEE